MKKLKVDTSTTNGIQAMRFEDHETVSDAVSSKEFVDDHPELVAMVAMEDSCWVSGLSSTLVVPTALENGHYMPAGMSYPIWIHKGEKVAVKGKINISW